MFVELSAQWERRAVEAGNARQDYAEDEELRPYGGDHGDQDYRANHILACRTECAVAKVLRLPWKANAGIITAVDVGGRVEVRARRVTVGRDLAIRPKDHDDRPYVQVLVYRDERMEILGYLWGREAKALGQSRGMWCAKRGVWFVPPPYRGLDELALLLTSAATSA